MTYSELLSRFITAMYNGFLSVVTGIVDDAILTQLEEAIKEGDFEQVFRLLGMTPGAFRPLTILIEQAFEEGAKLIASEYPKVVHTPDGKGVFRFNIHNERAQTYLRNESSSLISTITEDTRVVVRNVLETNAQRGVNPRTTALDIVGRYDRTVKRRVGGVIGLTPQQQFWVEQTRRQLESRDKAYLNRKLRDKRFDKLVTSDKSLTKDQIDKMVVRYTDNVLKYRAETIARYETMEALAAADYESTKQVVEMGAAREKDIKRVWDAVEDTRTRHSHREMEGQTVGLNEPFVTPSGERMMYPRDRSLGASEEERIGCRCTARNEIDWIGAAIRD